MSFPLYSLQPSVSSNNMKTKSFFHAVVLMYSIWVFLIQNHTTTVNYYLQKHSLNNRCKPVSK